MTNSIDPFGKTNTENAISGLQQAQMIIRTLITSAQNECRDYYGSTEAILADYKLPKELDLTLSDQLRILEYAFQWFDKTMSDLIADGKEHLAEIDAVGKPSSGNSVDLNWN